MKSQRPPVEVNVDRDPQLGARLKAILAPVGALVETFPLASLPLGKMVRWRDTEQMGWILSAKPAGHPPGPRANRPVKPVYRVLTTDGRRRTWYQDDCHDLDADLREAG